MTLVAASVSENFSSSSSARSLTVFLGSPYRSPISRRFSLPVSNSSTVAAWAVSPMALRTSAGSVCTSYPATRAVPEVGGLRVVIMRIVVVLPEPLGPSSPSTDPVGTEKEIPSTAVKSPNFLTRFSASIAGADDGAPGAGSEVLTRKGWTPSASSSTIRRRCEDRSCHHSPSAGRPTLR